MVFVCVESVTHCEAFGRFDEPAKRPTQIRSTQVISEEGSFMGNRRKKAWVAFAILSALVLVLGSVTLVGAATECSDGVDNDGDNLIDFSDNPSHPGDPECESLEDDSEAAQHQPSAVSCFAIADEGEGSTETDGDAIEDLLTKVDPDDSDPATNEDTVGTTGTMSVESLAFHPDTGDLYGVNGGQLGTFNLGTGAFTATAQPVGTGSGEAGDVNFDNIDGLAFDPDDATLYGVQRESNDPDLLVVIDPATGAHVPDAFGAGVDYAVIDPVAGLADINDLAIHTDGTVFAIATEDDAGDHLIKIDPANGNTTDVGATGLDDVEGLGFAPDGRLLGTAASDGNVLVDINTSTGAASNSRTLDNGHDYEGIACQAEAAPPPSDHNVTGVKYHDGNDDGARQENEAGVAGFEIHLFNEDESVHLHDTTDDPTGAYGFTVEPGTYTVCETLRLEDEQLDTQTQPTEGPDCSEHTGQPDNDNVGYEVTITEGGRSDGNDFGNGAGDGATPCPPGDSTISGTKWDDLNGDGVRDEGEPGLADVTIVAVRTEPAPPPDVRCEGHTAEDGTYSIVVPAGTYTVCEVLPSRRTQTFPTEGPDCAEITGPGTFGHEVTVAAGQESSGNDFGNKLDGDGECADGIDNEDEDPKELIDAADPACHTDLDVANAESYDPTIASEENPTCAEDYDGDEGQHGPSNLEGDEVGLISGIVHALDGLGPIPGITGDGSIAADTVNCGIVVGVLGL
jgi:SdrD B-like protein